MDNKKFSGATQWITTLNVAEKHARGAEMDCDECGCGPFAPVVFLEIFKRYVNYNLRNKNGV